MTQLDASYFEDIGGQVRGVLILVADRLPIDTVEFADEELDHNEPGLALETISEVLLQSRARISAEELRMIESAARRMNLDPKYYEPLRARVQVVEREA